MRFHHARSLRPRADGSTPTASVVVPCYNYGRYLPQLLASVLDQPGVDVDILIVDDASPDGSGAVADRLADADPRVRVLHHERNRGHIQTYNDGLAAVAGDYVILLSADDLLPAGAISRAVALMEAHPRVGLVYGYARSFSGEPPETSAEVRNWSTWPARSWLGVSARKARCFISSPEVVMRREALRQVGDYDASLPHSGDLDLWLRTALHWDIGRVNGPAQALYRVHEANMHLTTFAGMITDLRERRRTFELLYDQHGADRADVQLLRRRTMRSLARQAVRHAAATKREGGPAALIKEYLDFAVATDPAVVRGPRGRTARSALSGTELPGKRLRGFAARVRHHLEWRFERRYGT